MMVLLGALVRRLVAELQARREAKGAEPDEGPASHSRYKVAENGTGATEPLAGTIADHGRPMSGRIERARVGRPP
jgi:hypothetical protein